MKPTISSLRFRVAHTIIELSVLLVYNDVVIHTDGVFRLPGKTAAATQIYTLVRMRARAARAERSAGIGR